ncbi:hypothetical protein DV737_g901, partial [Chaetothyriales sp. CBS 132003]
MPYNNAPIARPDEVTGSSALPLARIKKIISQDDDIAQCSNSAAFAISVATEEFIRYLTQRAHDVAKAERKPRRHLAYKDIATAVSRHDNLEFLSQMVPKTTTMKQLRAEKASKERAAAKGASGANGMNGDAVTGTAGTGAERSEQARRVECGRELYECQPISVLATPTAPDPPLPPLPPSLPPLPRSPNLTMAPAPSSASSAVRSWTRHALPAAARSSRVGARPAASLLIGPNASQRRHRASAVGSASQSTFDTAADGGVDTTKIPSFKAYRSKSAEVSNRTFQYFMVGTMGLMTAVGAKATVQDFLVNMSASADVLAQAKVEVDLSTIPEGKNVIIKWRGKPVFIRHRTPDEIQEAESVDISSLRDPQSDQDRVKKPEWLVMLGVCTHLGCVPIGEAGDFGGWFCPCHGSHYDISGRVRKGPAPLNLEVPQYDFPEESSLVIG